MPVCGDTRGVMVCATQAQSKCYMPVDEPQRKLGELRLRMSMALFKRREGEVSVATAGVVTEAEPTRSGRMQGRKTTEKELVEGQSEADGQPR